MTSSVDSYNELASSVSPSAVSQYLAVHGWELESQRPEVREIWRLADERGRPQARLMLPLARDFDDYQERLRDALLALSRVNDWDASKLYEQITANRADLFFVRLDQEMYDGTIPFRQAEETLESLHKMLRAAATTAANPFHSHRGRRPASVSDFLDDDVRLGHTKRGSFIFTVVTRLGDQFHATADRYAPPENFPRKVMETLAHGLETTRDVAESWDPEVLESPGDLGLSAALVESLEEIARPESLRSLDLSFDWSSSEPLPEFGRNNIVLSRSIIAELPTVRERLIHQEEPPRRVTLIGVVNVLARDEVEEDDDGATIQLRAEVNGRYRNIRVPLAGDDHDWAVIAYQRKLPFTVTGDLVFERRSWRLQGDIEVDSTYLQQQRAT